MKLLTLNEMKYCNNRDITFKKMKEHKTDVTQLHNCSRRKDEFLLNFKRQM